MCEVQRRTRRCNRTTSTDADHTKIKIQNPHWSGAQRLEKGDHDDGIESRGSGGRKAR